MLKYSDLAEACKRANLPLPEVEKGEEWKKETRNSTTQKPEVTQRQSNTTYVQTAHIEEYARDIASTGTLNVSAILSEIRIHVRSFRLTYQGTGATVSVAVIAAAAHAHASGLAGACGLLGGLLTCAFKPAPTLALALAAGAVGGMVLWS